MEGRPPLECLFDEVADGVCITDPGGRLSYVNPAAAAILGPEPRALAGQSLCSILCDRLAGPGGPAPGPGVQPLSSGCPLLAPGGGERAATFSGRFSPRAAFAWSDSSVRRVREWHDLRVRCLRLPQGAMWRGQEGHLALIEDVTAERELERHKADWRDMVAHDLRAPTTNILGALAVLDDCAEGEPLGPGEKRLVAGALRSVRRMAELLNDHLDVARLDAGMMPVRLGSVALGELVSGVVEESSVFARGRDIAVTVKMAAGLCVRADADLLARVLQNLLNNAVKFNQEGGRVTVAARPAAGGVLLWVRDTGPGIPAADLPNIFDRFYQACARREGRIEGVGLGLTFCLEALKAMGGSIYARSRLGRGSVFVVRLPPA